MCAMMEKLRMCSIEDGRLLNGLLGAPPGRTRTLPHCLIRRTRALAWLEDRSASSGRHLACGVYGSARARRAVPLDWMWEGAAQPSRPPAPTGRAALPAG